MAQLTLVFGRMRSGKSRLSLERESAERGAPDKHENTTGAPRSALDPSRLADIPLRVK
jgi:hypothetical protein